MNETGSIGSPEGEVCKSVIVFSSHISHSLIFSVGKIVDYSMIDAVEAEHSNSDSPVDIGRRAFDDLTDLQNDEFIVSTLHIL